jgi:hypothetical protein
MHIDKHTCVTANYCAPETPIRGGDRIERRERKEGRGEEKEKQKRKKRQKRTRNLKTWDNIEPEMIRKVSVTRGRETAARHECLMC